MPRIKKLTDYAYSPTNPASEDAIRSQIDDAIQEVYDFTTTSDLASTTVPTAIEEVYAKASATVPVLEITDARTSSIYGAFGTLPLRLDNTDQKIRDLAVNVKDFGAVGDGVADDTIAIQNAIDSGKSIFIPKGIYLISASLKLDNATIIIGEGVFVTTIKTLGSINAFEKLDQSLMTPNVVFENFNIEGNGTGTHGIILFNMPRLVMKQIQVDNFTNGIVLYAWVSSFERIYVGNTTNGFVITGGTSITAKQCYSNTCVNGFVIGDLDNVYGAGVRTLTYSTFLNCAADSVTEYSYKVLGSDTTNFINCGTEDVTKGMFFIGDGKDISNVQIIFNDIAIDNPRAFLNDGLTTTDCFIELESVTSTVNLKNFFDSNVDGLYTDLIKGAINSSSSVMIDNMKYTFLSNSFDNPMSINIANKYGINSEHRSTIPFLSQNNNKQLNLTTFMQKTDDRDFEMFVFAPNDGDICFGTVELMPLTWADGGATKPPMGIIRFFAYNNSGTIVANIIDEASVFTISGTIQATSSGQICFRLFVSSTNLTTPQYQFIVKGEIYSDQNTVTQRTVLL